MDFAVLFSGSKFLNKKIKVNIKNILVCIGLLLFTTINYILSDNVLRVSIFYLAIMFCYKLLFKAETTRCSFAAFVSYLIVFLSEMVYVIIILMLAQDGKSLLPDQLSNYDFVLANFFISLIATIIYKILGKKISKVTELISDKNKFFAYCVFFLNIGTIAAILSKISLNRWLNDESFWFNTIIFFGVIIVGFTVIKQFYDKRKLESQYDEFVTYATNTEKLLEQYRVAQHENINELLIVKSMVKKNNAQLLNYLKQILKEKDNFEHKWINELKYLPFGGLKGIMHYKISEMKEYNINVKINISKEVQNSKLSKLEERINDYICKVICVFLDNAREAVINLDDKKVFISVYCDKGQVIFEIANTFEGDINIKTINEKGKSTKGKDRGYGLFLVKNLVDKTNFFEHETIVNDDLFVQKLIVK